MNHIGRFLTLIFLTLSCSDIALCVTINGQLEKALLEKQSSAPTGIEGRIYYDLTQKKAQIYDGTNWTSIGSSVFSPLAYAQAKTALVAVGSVGNNQAGHTIDASDFPSGLTTSQYSFWNASVTDGNTTNAKNLTNVGTTATTATGIAGVSGAFDFTGSTKSLTSSSTFFNPGPGVSFAMGGWFYAAAWSSVPSSTLMGQWQSNADRGFNIQPVGNIIAFQAASTASGSEGNLIVTIAAGGGWHHFVELYDATNTKLKAYVDGRLVASQTLATVRAVTSPAFGVAKDGNAGYFVGRAEEMFFVNGGTALTDDDVRRLYAARLSHNLLVAPEKQLWSGNWYRADSSIANQLSDSWLVSKDTTKLWYDFNDLAAGSFVDFGAQNMATSGTVVPIGLYDSGQLTAAPGTTIAHGLGIIPEVVTLQYEVSGTAGKPTSLESGDYCDWDNTNLYCDWTGLTVDATHRLRVKAAVAQTSIAVPSASTIASGLVNTTTQSFAGAKTFAAAPTFSAGVVGDTSGALATSGNVAQEFVVTGTSTAFSASTHAVATIALPSAGDWMIYVGFLNALGTASGWTSTTCAISSSSSSIDAGAKIFSIWSTHDSASAGSDQRSGSVVRHVTPSTAATYYATCQSTYTTAGTGANLADVLAVRIR
jgi:hypothetical protein